MRFLHIKTVKCSCGGKGLFVFDGPGTTRVEFAVLIVFGQTQAAWVLQKNLQYSFRLQFTNFLPSLHHLLSAKFQSYHCVTWVLNSVLSSVLDEGKTYNFSVPPHRPAYIEFEYLLSTDYSFFLFFFLHHNNNVTLLLPLLFKEDSNYSLLSGKLKYRSPEKSLLIFHFSAEDSLHLRQEIGHVAAQLCLILDLQRLV